MKKPMRAKCVECKKRKRNVIPMLQAEKTFPKRKRSPRTVTHAGFICRDCLFNQS